MGNATVGGDGEHDDLGREDSGIRETGVGGAAGDQGREGGEYSLLSKSFMYVNDCEVLVIFGIVKM